MKWPGNDFFATVYCHMSKKSSMIALDFSIEDRG
uniref:Uncharacterized protein n=1 Tax=Arundo donax TaxID=35708 RepID=A0A0A9FZT6_ARUDO